MIIGFLGGSLDLSIGFVWIGIKIPVFCHYREINQLILSK